MQAVGLRQKHTVFPPCVIWGKPYIHTYHRNDYCLPSSNIWSVSAARLFCWFVCFLSGCGQELQDRTQMLPGRTSHRIPDPCCRQAASITAPSDFCAHIPYPQFELMLQQCSHSCAAYNLLHSISEKDKDWDYRYAGLFWRESNEKSKRQIYYWFPTLSQKLGQRHSKEIGTVMLSTFSCCFMTASCFFHLCICWLQTQQPA